MRYCMLLAVLVLLPCLAEARSASPRKAAPSGVLFQQKIGYETAQGDTLRSIGARFGVDGKGIAKENALDPSSPLKAGQHMRITVRKIIPKVRQKGIMIDIPGRMLYLFRGNKLAMAVPVGLGMPKKGAKRGWKTPAGAFTVKGKLKSPTWRVPKSIQEEMKREGATARESIPPGPKSPLGRYTILTSIRGIMIHETTDPSTVFRFKSHGCIRVMPEQMKQLFAGVGTGMHGEAVYRPVKVASLGGGRVFMEVNEDIYKKVKSMNAEARRLLRKSGQIKNADMDKVRRAVKEKSGVPVEVTLTPSPASSSGR